MSLAQKNRSLAQKHRQGTSFTSDAEDTVSWSKVIFADGSTVWTRAGPAADHVFHPVMLKYVLICALIYALLQNRSGLEDWAVWQISIYWLLINVVTVFWLFIAAALAIRLLQRRAIRFVFTPLISLPLVMVVELFLQVYLTWGLGRPFAGVGSIAPHVSRDLMVILLFDILYGSFVAPHNPAYRMSDPRLDAIADGKVHLPQAPVQKQRSAAVVMAAQPGPEVPPPVTVPTPETVPQVAPDPVAPTEPGPDQPEAVLPEPQPPAAPLPDTALAEQTIELAGERLRVADLLVIKAEDHYVRIQQRARSHLLRGRFSDVIASVPPGTGIALNRSVWVSVAGVRMLHRTQDHRIMVMAVDDQLHPVARARKSEVLEFARRHDLPIARRKMLPSDFE